MAVPITTITLSDRHKSHQRLRIQIERRLIRNQNGSWSGVPAGVTLVDGTGARTSRTNICKTRWRGYSTACSASRMAISTRHMVHIDRERRLQYTSLQCAYIVPAWVKRFVASERYTLASPSPSLTVECIIAQINLPELPSHTHRSSNMTLINTEHCWHTSTLV